MRDNRILGGVIPKKGRTSAGAGVIPPYDDGLGLVPMSRAGSQFTPGGVRGWLREKLGRRAAGSPELPGPPSVAGEVAPHRRSAYAGDFAGVPQIAYQPHPDDLADPGEVVWAWVPYEEDHARGKDRPVLMIGRDQDLLLAVPLTSKDHDRDAGQEVRAGGRWLDIGSGPWDPKGRPSEVRTNRILRLDPAAVRRIGATLDRPMFEAVAAAVLAGRG